MSQLLYNPSALLPYFDQMSCSEEVSIKHEQKLRKSSNSNFCGLSPVSTRALGMSCLHQDDFLLAFRLKGVCSCCSAPEH